MKEALKRKISALRRGELSEKGLLSFLENFPFSDERSIKLDFHRRLRRGIPEVIFGQGKSPEQLRRIIGKFSEMGEDLLITRVDAGRFAELKKEFPSLCYHDAARIVTCGRRPVETHKGRVLVLSAGASDERVAEEAYVSSRYLGNRTDREYDVGIACLARVLSLRARLNRATVIIAVAGMEGALPSVVALRPVGAVVDAQLLRRRHLGGQHRQRLRRRLPGDADQSQAFLIFMMRSTMRSRCVPGQ